MINPDGSCTHCGTEGCEYCEQGDNVGPGLDETDPTLLWLLRRAGDEWGPRGVARAAALLAAADAAEASRMSEARTLVPELVAEVERLRGQVRQMRRQTELFMEDGDRNRLTVALAVSDE